MGLDLSGNGSSGRSKPGCRIVGSETIVWLTTEADDQSSLHCVTVSTDVTSDHIGRRDASRGGGRSVKEENNTNDSSHFHIIEFLSSELILVAINQTMMMMTTIAITKRSVCCQSSKQRKFTKDTV